MPPASPLVRRLLAANLAVFVLALLAGFSGRGADNPVVALLELDSSAFLSGFPWHLPRLATYGFLHEDPMHLAMNALGLYFFGTMTEGAMGHRRFLWVYGGAILVGGLVFLVWSATGDRIGGRLLGMSGGVYAVLIASAVLFPDSRVILFVFPMKLRTLAIGAFALAAVYSLQRFQVSGGAPGGVAEEVHLAGALWGWGAVRFPEHLASFRARRRRDSAERDRRMLADAREEMDDLLSKVKRDGIGSLTSREKERLTRIGRKLQDRQD